MPAKYVIHTRLKPHRFEPLTKSGIIAWEEGCLKCAVCVKKRCVYGVYDKRGLDARQMVESIDNLCMNCLRCVQGCPKELIHKSFNPEYAALGDEYWGPEIISRLWYQAETGKIPVSGAGYPGPFSGPGFDSMWTDMSEIVRPTRDGIHGREYISTAIDLGRTPHHLSFDGDTLKGELPKVIDIPLPIMLKVPPFGDTGAETLKGWAMAAKRLGTLLALPMESVDDSLDKGYPWLMPLVEKNGSQSVHVPAGVRIAEVPWTDDGGATWSEVGTPDGRLFVSVRIPMSEGVEDKALSLVQAGASIIHVEGSRNGRYLDNGAFTLKDGIRSVHLKLVEARVREGVTLLASGGLAMAEHVAKALICGADAVFVDIPILLALECRMCGRCEKGLSCPVEVGQADAAWVAYRVINLLGAWQNQLLEVMGAMGIRDARRLRGEAGRAMFFEDLDRSTFESLGKVEEGFELE
jgi:ferredoxin